jgi:hypothetical protein
MKTEVLQTLLTAKVLLNKAQDLCFVEDKYTASSGLIVLQDALEHIFLACLIELGVDEKKSIENFSFDQLIGELKTEGIKVVKSGTLKALNKQRVIIKHYGQVSDPSTAANYYGVAEYAVKEILKQVINKTLQEVVLHELIKKEEIKKYFTDAVQAIEQKQYFDALMNVRKAIFVELESDYCVYGWLDFEAHKPRGLPELSRGGLKAPFYMRNKKWISENVYDPFDYIQLDYDRIRQDIIEWGASTQDFWNITRLTPDVMRLDKDSDWLLKGELQYIRQGATEENALYCLDRAVTLLSKKEVHEGLSKWISYRPEHEMNVRIKRNELLFNKASKNSEKIAELKENAIYRVAAVVPGLDGKGKFVHISQFQEDGPIYLRGYVDVDACEPLEQQG